MQKSALPPLFGSRLAGNSGLRGSKNGLGGLKLTNMQAFNDFQKAKEDLSISMQGESNKIDRDIMKRKSVMNEIQLEFNPQLISIQKRNESNNKLVDMLINQINQIKSKNILKMQNKSNELQSNLDKKAAAYLEDKINRTMKQKTEQDTKCEEINHDITEFFQEKDVKLEDITNRSNAVLNDVSNFNKRTISTINQIQPRINEVKAQIESLELKSDAFIELQKQNHDISSDQEDLEAILKNFQGDGLEEIVSQALDKFNQNLTSQMKKLQKKVIDQNTKMDNSLEVIRSSKEIDKELNRKLTAESKKFDAHKSRIENDNDLILELDKILRKLESQVKDLHSTGVSRSSPPTRISYNNDKQM